MSHRLLLTLIFGIVSMMLMGCSHLFYHPSRAMFHPPQNLLLYPEKLEWSSKDGTQISGWHFKTKALKTKGLILQCHGNAQNMTSHYLSLVWLLDHGYDLVTFDYRGYGISEGKPSHKGVVEDAVSALSNALRISKGGWATPKNKKLPLILYGQSLGGAVCLKALELFSNRNEIAAVVIESSFLDYQKMAKDVLSRSFLTWLFQPLAYVLVSNEMGPGRNPANWKGVPILILHGTNDRVVPIHLGWEIYEWAPEPKEFWEIPNADHLEVFFIDGQKYRPEFVQKLENLIGISKSP